MIRWGINALNHDAAITVMDGDDIKFAGHAERYSRIKNDSNLNQELINDALRFGAPQEIIWFERPWLKKIRYLKAGQWAEFFDESPKQHLKKFGLAYVPLKYSGHHESHAAAGYFTSKFKDAAIVVVDAIGELDTASVWYGEGNTIKKLHSSKYPHSIGLAYSAFTQRVGLKPNEEEYILMGMAAYGKPIYSQSIRKELLNLETPSLVASFNAHRGLDPSWMQEAKDVDLAASIQHVTELFMVELCRWAKEQTGSKNLVLMGGCALNCVANSKIAENGLFKNIWIMPNPGDGGSSLGAILARTKRQANWTNSFLGFNIDRPLDINQVVDGLIQHKIIAVANGPAEFGPRALGHRSLLADPRGQDVKDRVNDIKKRQRFRPFAPIILANHAHDYFDLPVSESPYMQFTAKCNYPYKFPAIIHIDGTSRVQTVSEDDNPLMFAVLTEFYKRTGCPMLLNTSLNIKGEPLVNTWEDALRFQQKHKVKVF